MELDGGEEQVGREGDRAERGAKCPLADHHIHIHYIHYDSFEPTACQGVLFLILCYVCVVCYSLRIPHTQNLSQNNTSTCPSFRLVFVQFVAMAMLVILPWTIFEYGVGYAKLPSRDSHLRTIVDTPSSPLLWTVETNTLPLLIPICRWGGHVTAAQIGSEAK